MSDDELIIRPMVEGDLDAAVRIFRLAFGTYFGVPEPATFRSDIDFITPRWKTDAKAAFVAENAGRVVGSIIGTSWGSQFVIGPLSVDPAQWGRGVARELMARLMALAAERAARLTVLYTMPNSATHLRLYESFGLAPFMLTTVLTKAADTAAPGAAAFWRFSRLPGEAQPKTFDQCRAITDAVYPGLDLNREIAAVTAFGFGDTVMIGEGGAVAGFAVCHFGAGTEAGEGTLFVKFATVRPGAARDFERLLDAIEQLGVAFGAKRIVAGVNTGRRDAYRRLLARGFRVGQIGVAMQRPEEPGTLRPDAYVIDDWR